MSIKSRFITSGAGKIRSFKIKDQADTEHEVHYYAKTPNEIAQHFAAQTRFEATAEGDAARQNHRAEFIALSMVEPDGSPMFTLEEAKLIPVGLKPIFVAGIVEGSNEIEGVKKS